MGHEILGSSNGNGPRAERFSEVRQLPPVPPRQAGAQIAIPGYCPLGPDENGIEEVLFIPICRRIKVLPRNEAGHELVRIQVEDKEWIEYGPAQSLELMYRTGIRERPKPDSLIIVPDNAIKTVTPFGS